MLPEPAAGVVWRAGTADDADAIADVALAADRVDEPGNERDRSDVLGVLRLVEPRTAVVIGERGGQVVAAGVLFRPGGGPVRMIGAVLPGARDRGIGRALLAAQIAAAEASHPDAPSMTVRAVGRHGVGGLARRAGLGPERVFLTLRRDLTEPVASDELPAGLRAVPFEPALDEAVRVSRNEVFLDHWQATVTGPDEWRDRNLGPRLIRELSSIALDAEGAVAGFVLAWRTPARPGQLHIPLVGTPRAHRGRGVARALLTTTLAGAAAVGLAEAVLDVDAASATGAVGVYEGVGFAETGRATIWSRTPS